MGSSCWKMKNVREQFRIHWPERIVGRKEEDVGAALLQTPAGSRRFFPLPFLPLVSFKGKLGRLMREK